MAPFAAAAIRPARDFDLFGIDRRDLDLGGGYEQIELPPAGIAVGASITMAASR